MKKTCPCNNPKCPNSKAYNACEHCMCLTNPEFPPNSTIGWGGPISKVCCKCSYQVPIGATWGTSLRYRDGQVTAREDLITYQVARKGSGGGTSPPDILWSMEPQ